MRRLVVAALVALPALAQQTHPNTATGSTPETLYASSGQDQINLFNGNLTYRIPIGSPVAVGPLLRLQAALVYNSNFYRTWAVSQTVGSHPPVETVSPELQPAGDRVVGLGWQLHFGRLVDAPPLFSVNKAPLPGLAAAANQPTGTGRPAGMLSTYLAFQDPDGSTHEFFDRKFESTCDVDQTPTCDSGPSSPNGWPSGSDNWLANSQRCWDSSYRSTFGLTQAHCYAYTHDGSYLRLDPVDPEHGYLPTVYFPDGTIVELRHVGGRYALNDNQFQDSYLPYATLNPGYDVTALLDPYGNAIRVRYYGDGPSTCYERQDHTCPGLDSPPSHPLTTGNDNEKESIPWRAEDVAFPTTRYIQVNAPSTSGPPQITQVLVPSAFVPLSGTPNQVAYNLSYVPVSTFKFGGTGLSSLVLPTGDSYVFTYKPSADAGGGRLASVGLPTGGSLEFDYAALTFWTRQPNSSCGAPSGNYWCTGFQKETGTQLSGVSARRTIRRVVRGSTASTEIAQTDYVRSYYPDADSCSGSNLSACRERVDVWSPVASPELTNVSRTTFAESDGLQNAALYGRPLSVSDYYLSPSVSRSSATLDSISTPTRTTSYTYGFDGRSGCVGGIMQSSFGGFVHNTREATRTTTWSTGATASTSHTTPTCAAPTASSWDGFGHWGDTVVSEGSTTLRRVDETYQITATPESGGTATPARWILTGLASRHTYRPAIAGDPAGATLDTFDTFVVDPLTGFTTRQSTDSGDGRTLRTDWTLPPSGTAGTPSPALCAPGGAYLTQCANLGFATNQTTSLLQGSTVLSSYKSNFFYYYSNLARSYDDSTSFYTLDRDIDVSGHTVKTRGPEAHGPTSGLFASGCIPNGTSTPIDLSTVITYDPLDRVATVTPPGEGVETTTYTNQSATTVKSDSTLTLPLTKTFFDQLGRPTVTLRRMPDSNSSYSYRVKSYDPSGRRVGLSEWQAIPCSESVPLTCSSLLDKQATFSGTSSTPGGTVWSGFEMLGRPGTTTRADGTFTTDAYQGWWSQTSSRTIYTNNVPPPPTQQVSTVVTRDFLGRVVSVQQPATRKVTGIVNSDWRTPLWANMNSGTDTATYRYDHLDRLISASTTGSDSSAGNSTTQLRVRTYDGFGWLTREQTPEVPDYRITSRDARGNPLTTCYFSGSSCVNTITKAYDTAGRLISSVDPGDALHPFEEYTYDTIAAVYPSMNNGCSNGRLVRGIRHDHARNSYPSDFGWFDVQDLYHYNAAAGHRLSFRQTSSFYIDGTPSNVRIGGLAKPASSNPLRDYFISVGRHYPTSDDATRSAAQDEDDQGQDQTRHASGTLHALSANAPTGWLHWNYDYDFAGRLSSIVYPRRDEAPNSSLATTSSVAYAAGLPVSITGTLVDPFVGATPIDTITGNLTYNPSGTVQNTTVSSLNGAATVFALATADDTSGIARPRQWRLNNGATEDRALTYDSSGDLWRITNTTTNGTTRQHYLYDARNRLIQDVAFDQTNNFVTGTTNYIYDGFGNLLLGSSGNLNADRTTNRLSGSYWAHDMSRGWMTYDPTTLTARDYYPDGILVSEWRHDNGTSAPRMSDGMNVYLQDSAGEREMTYWGQENYCDTELLRNSARDESARILTDYQGFHQDTGCSCTPPATGPACIWTDKYIKDYVYLGPYALATYNRISSGLRISAVDHLGSPRTTFTNAGTVASSMKFDSFGTEAGVSGSERLRFTGHERNHAIGDGTLMPISDNMHARQYVPMLGRFTRPDPYREFHLTEPQGMNRYSYAHDNPVNFVDLLGLLDSSIEVIAKDPFGEQLKAWLWSVAQFKAVTAPPVFATMEYLSDKVAFNIASPTLKIMSGAINDDLGEMAEGMSSQLLDAIALAYTGIGPDLGFDRTAAASLVEEGLLAEAKAGAVATRIMKGKIRDWRYPEKVFAKMQLVGRDLLGRPVVMHFWQNIKSGYRFGFKFK